MAIGELRRDTPQLLLLLPVSISKGGMWLDLISCTAQAELGAAGGPARQGASRV